MEKPPTDKKELVIIGILLIAFITVAIPQYSNFQIQQIFKAKSNNDFKHFYFGAELLRKGGNPYDPDMLFQAARAQRVQTLNPYVYPVFTGLILSPLTFLRFEKASDIWAALNHLWFFLSMIFLYLSVWSYQKRQSSKEQAGEVVFPLKTAGLSICLIYTLASFSIPFYRNLSAGQMNSFLLFIYSLCFFFYSKNTAKSDIAAGVTAAFGTMFKISPGIFLIYFLLKKRWNAAGGMLSGLVLFTLISLLAAGWETNISYLPLLKQMGYGKSTWAEFGMTYYKDPYNQGFNSFFHHIFSSDNATTAWINLGEMAANIITILTAIPLFIFGGFVVKNNKDSNSDIIISGLDFSVFIFLSLLIPSLMWDHYLIQIWFAYFFLFPAVLRKGYIHRLILAICLVLLNIHIPFQSFTSGIFLLLMSAKLWFTLLLFCLTISLMRKQPAIK